MKTWLILDVHYLCHRAFHTMQNLSYQEKPTGVIYGFLKSITALKDEFQTDRVAFCFEHRHLFRRDVFPAYKQRRNSRPRTEPEQAAYESFAIQINELRKRYLPRIGFKNIFCSRGFESDDLMAEIARCSDSDEEIILVTADSDMFQCLTSNVRIFHPQKQKLVTDVCFKKTYGVHASEWAEVKAIAGCSGDEVPGIRGVGEFTAIKYLRRELKHDSQAYQRITSEDGKMIIRRNRRLVKLPFQGCPTPELVEDEIDCGGWREVCGLLGMRSIASHPPIATRRMR